MSDFMSDFDKLYMPKLGARGPTFRAVLREAMARQVMSVFETGCIRKEDNWAGDGQSTIILAHFMRHQGGSFLTCDLSEDAIATAKRLVPGVYTRTEDSVLALKTHASSIDMLYLDSFDVDMDHVHPAALHCLFELCSAMPKLHPGSIIFVDDSPVAPDMSIGGKATYVAKYLDKHLGIKPFTFGYQAAWIMP